MSTPTYTWSPAVVAAAAPQVTIQPTAIVDAAPQVTIAFPSAVTPDRGGCTYNQDRAFVDPAGRRIAVFDGHGDLGEVAAQVAADTILAARDLPPAAAFANAESAIHTALRDTMTARGVALIEEEGSLYRRGAYGARGAIVRGGTTASVLTIAEDGALSVTNVGDSDVVVFDGVADPGTSLTADHSCTALTEWVRIHAACPTTRFKFSNPFSATAAERPVWLPKAVMNPEEEEPWTLNPAGGYHYCDVRNSWATYFTAPDGSESLAMTRALGDFHLKRYGLSAEPAVQTHPAPVAGTVRAIVIGSDGLWDSLHFEEARAIVYRADLVTSLNADAATAALLEYGKTRARALMGASHDNITAAVVYVTATAVTELAVADSEAITVTAAE